jgi:hypothetical protein
VKRALIQVQKLELLDVGLVKLFKGEYASTIIRSTRKDIFGNWIKDLACVGIIIQ